MDPAGVSRLMDPAGVSRADQPSRRERRVAPAPIVLLASLVSAGTALGAGEEFWLSPGILSHHFQQGRGFREVNYGLGAQWVLDPHHALLAGEFRNSDDAVSHYAALYWRPLSWGPVSLGLVAGGFDGYAAVHQGGWFPAVLPMASVNLGRVGFNLTVLPSLGERLHGAVAAQLLLRLY